MNKNTEKRKKQINKKLKGIKEKRRAKKEEEKIGWNRKENSDK